MISREILPLKVETTYLMITREVLPLKVDTTWNNGKKIEKSTTLCKKVSEHMVTEDKNSYHG